MGLRCLGRLHDPLLRLLRRRWRALEAGLRAVQALRPAVRRAYIRRLCRLCLLPGHSAVDGQPERLSPGDNKDHPARLAADRGAGATALFTHGSEFANNIAAMPSLHAAYPMFLLLFFWRRARTWVRALLVSYVLAMAFTLVYTAEHFVIDELAGWCAAIAVYFVGSRLLDWRRAHVSTGASWSARTRLRRSRLTATPEAQPSALTLPEAPPPG